MGIFYDMLSEYAIERMPHLEAVLARLEDVKEYDGYYKALCPTHDDREPSLSIWLNDRSKVCVKCHAGCNDLALLSHLGLAISDLYPDNGHARDKRKTLKVYDYHDLEGNVIHQTVRHRPKGFSQRRPGGNGKPLWSLKGIEPVLYQLPEVAKAIDEGRAVFLAEGEKDADNARERLGVTATTCPMGAGKWRDSYTQALKGAHVVLIPDNDSEGHKHMHHVACELTGVAASVKVVELPDLPHKGDVTDWMDAGGTTKGLRELVEATSPYTPNHGNGGNVGGNTKPGTTPPADPEQVGMTKLLADAITAEEHFAQDAGGKLYRFSDGVYKQFAERFIKRRVKELAEEWGETKRWSAHRANEVTEYIRADAPVLWERPPLDEINLRNGIFNIWTRCLRDHDPAFLSTVQIPVEYDPDAACPEWDKFVATTFPEDAQALAFELAADLMTPERSEQKSILFIGEGSNGKSTSLTAFTNFIGSTNIVGLSLQKMESDRFSSSRLLGKLANICPDLPSSHLAGTSMFKAVTGGDAINAEYKYRESFEFRPFARLVFSANQVPRSEDATHAFFRRWLVVPFDRTFEGGEQISRQELDAKLSAPKELSGVLNKALDALPGLRRNGFTESAKMKEAWEEFRSMTDPVSVWLDKNTVLDPDVFVSKDALLFAYNDAARTDGRATLTKTSFSQALKRLRSGIRDGQRTVNGRPKTWCWIGIGLCAPGPEDPEQGPGVYFTDSSGSQPSQVSQLSTNCFLNEATTDNTNAEGGSWIEITNKEKPVNPVNPVNGVVTTVDKALEAMRNGNGPRKVVKNISQGTQNLEELAKAVMCYYGAKRFDGWETWLAPVAEALDVLVSEGDVA
jgi:putative DNA primase/helicase